MNAPVKTLTLDQLAQAWLDAKEEEESAVAKRRQIGELLAAALPGADEGTTSAKVDDLKVVVTRKITRTVDTAALQTAWEKLPVKVQAAFKWAASLDLKTFRAFQTLAAPELATVQTFITTKPAAASVSVEHINKE